MPASHPAPLGCPTASMAPPSGSCIASVPAAAVADGSDALPTPPQRPLLSAHIPRWLPLSDDDATHRSSTASPLDWQQGHQLGGSEHLGRAALLNAAATVKS